MIFCLPGPAIKPNQRRAHPNQRLQPTAPGGILSAPRLNRGRYASIKESD
jgi:hypothetical protein